MATAKEKKEIAQVAETVVAEKAATPTETAKKPAAKTAAKSTTKTTKAASKTSAKPKAAAKSTAKAKEEVFIQLAGNEITAEELIAKSKKLAGIKTIKSVNVYVRPEINRVFYVINGDVFGDFDLY